jgi:hypothetical protein
MADEETWDESRARAMIGRTMLVGLTYLDPSGNRVEQFHGEVISADCVRGVELRLAGQRSGETFVLPPDLSHVFAAAPGLYTLRATGEVVENPDFTATWEIHPPEDRPA